MVMKLLGQTRCFSSLGKQGQFFPSIPTGQRIKRFYKKVDVVEHPHNEKTDRKLDSGTHIDFSNISKSEKYWAVTLDGKVTKTMYKDELLLPTRAIAVALAEEWEQ